MAPALTDLETPGTVSLTGACRSPPGADLIAGLSNSQCRQAPSAHEPIRVSCYTRLLVTNGVQPSVLPLSPMSSKSPITTVPDSLAAKQWAADVLKEIAAERNMKKRFKRLSPQERDEVHDAIVEVALHKFRAYAQAHQGVIVDTFGWMAAVPELSQVSRRLARELIDMRDIPMLVYARAESCEQAPPAAVPAPLSGPSLCLAF